MKLRLVGQKRIALSRTAGVISLAVALLTTSLAVAFASDYKPIVVRAGDLIVTADAGISPSDLPKDKRVPIIARVNGAIKTVDGAHVPPASNVTVEVDKGFAVNAEGLPVCHVQQIIARSTAEAKRVCGDAIVGKGFAEAQVAFPEQPPFTARGPLLFFNGGVKDRATLLLVHLYAAVPAPTAIVTLVELTKINKGRYGTKAVANVPKIAGGSGSIIGFNFSIGRNSHGQGVPRGYIEAKCPKGNYLTRADVTFEDKTSYRAAVALPCGEQDHGGSGYGKHPYSG